MAAEGRTGVLRNGRSCLLALNLLASHWAVWLGNARKQPGHFVLRSNTNPGKRGQEFHCVTNRAPPYKCTRAKSGKKLKQGFSPRSFPSPSLLLTKSSQSNLALGSQSNTRAPARHSAAGRGQQRPPQSRGSTQSAVRQRAGPATGAAAALGGQGRG